MLTNWYMKGMTTKKVVPTISHTLRPHRSDKNPKKGFSIIPVRVETETMKPSSAGPAPRDAANIGNRGILPI